MTDINDPFIPQLTSFEGNLIRLRTLMNKMELMFKHFTSIEDVGNEFNFKSLLREYIIIQLFAFMAVKRSLDRDLHEMGKDALNDCLRPLWQPIMDYERPIREMRNGYLAHIQDITPVFERHIEIITFESGFPSSWADSLFFALRTASSGVWP